MQIFAISTADIKVQRSRLLVIQELLDFRPGLVASIAEVRSYLLINFINMLLLHFSCSLNISFLINSSFIAFSRYFSLHLAHKRSVLSVAKSLIVAVAGSVLDLSKSERDSPGPEFQPAFHFVDFSRGNRMEPVVPAFSTEDHELSWHHVHILSHAIRVLEMHASPTPQGKRYKNLFKRRMSINMWGNSLTRRVVVYRKLIEHAMRFEETLLRHLEIFVTKI